jgi:hypothetical protein
MFLGEGRKSNKVGRTEPVTEGRPCDRPDRRGRRVPCLASTPEGSSTLRLLTSSESLQVEVIYWRANVVIELVGRVAAGWMLEVSLDADVAGVEILVQQAADVKALGLHVVGVGTRVCFLELCFQMSAMQARKRSEI